MAARDACATLSPVVRRAALLLALLAAACAPARAQEKAAAFVPREEMIDALMRYAASGGCETRREVFGTGFAASCGGPDAGGDEPMRMWLLLERLGERDLVVLCRQNRIADCERPREVSEGRPILTFESAFDVEFTSYRATWSPDGRLLLLDNLNLPKAEVRVLDVASGRLLGPPLYAGPIHDAAWSPDGAYIALGDRRRAFPGQAPPVGSIRLYSAGTRKPLARRSVADAGCSLALLEGMAFADDSRALWVLCSQADKTAKAVKLGVPGLGVAETFTPVSPVAGLQESYWEEGIVRARHELVATVRFRGRKPARRVRSAVQPFLLRTRTPLFAPVPAAAGSAHLAPDLSGLFIGSELWNGAEGRRVATGIDPSGRYLGAPDRLPRAGMRIEARPVPKSRRNMLAVLDGGTTVQELGPVPKVLAILVSPDGQRVAVSGFHGIRFYRVNADAAAAPGR
jgi:hypothetical protein